MSHVKDFTLHVNWCTSQAKRCGSDAKHWTSYARRVRQTQNLVRHITDVVRQTQNMVRYITEVVRQTPNLVRHMTDVGRQTPNLVRHTSEVVRQMPDSVRHTSDIQASQNPTVKSPEHWSFLFVLTFCRRDIRRRSVWTLRTVVQITIKDAMDDISFVHFRFKDIKYSTCL